MPKMFGNHCINNYGTWPMEGPPKDSKTNVGVCGAVSEPSHKKARVVDRSKKDFCCQFKLNIDTLPETKLLHVNSYEEVDTESHLSSVSNKQQVSLVYVCACVCFSVKAKTARDSE